MTAPRQVLAGTTYLVTRRCAQRQYLLRPDRTSSEVFLYVLALAAQRYGVQVHAYCVLSNHYHLVVTDTRAQLPAFAQLLDALVARALNAFLGRWESFWAPCSFSAVTLAGPEDVVSKTAYVLANPVAARLVRSACQWPGLWSSPGSIGSAAFQVRRPRHFFDSKGGLPELIGLEVATPPGFETAQAFREQLVPALATREASAARSASGFLGVLKVLAQRPTDRPTSGDPRRRLSPRVAAADKRKRLEAVGGLAAFLDAYRMARDAWRAGRRKVVFPCGTYLMRIAHGAPCAAPATG